MTAAGALAGMPGMLGLLGAAIMGVKLASDLLIGLIDKEQERIASDTIGQFFLDRGKGLGVGGRGDVLLQPGQIPMGGAHGDMVRSNAQSVLQEGLSQGFIKASPGGGLEMDKMAMSAFVDRQKAMSDDDKARAKAMFGQAFGLQAIDPQLRDFARGKAYGTSGMAKFGAGGLTPGYEGGTWQEQMALGAFDARAAAGAPGTDGVVVPGAAPTAFGAPHERPLMIQVTLEPGMVLKSDKNARRKGGR
jgi:hypothetical protein